MSGRELPAGWMLAEIGEVAKIVTGGTPPKSDTQAFGGSVPFFKPGDLDLADVIDDAEQRLTEQGAGAVGLLPAGSVLVSCIGNLGKTARISRPASCNQQINAILPSDMLEPAFVHAWAKTIKKWLQDNSSATTISIINKGRFSKAEIPIPPRSEQRQIVEKIEALTARSRRAREALDTLPALIDRYRQSILAAAFRDNLMTKGQISDGRKLDSDAGLYPIPQGWKWVAMQDLVSFGPQNGLYLPKSKYGSGHPISSLPGMQR